jgi:uncharacterized membrane protein YoaT (DUF817 family)
LHPSQPVRGLAQFLVLFALKQASAYVFGICLLLAMIGTRVIWQDDWVFARYDALLLIAIALQIVFLKTGIETFTEAGVILLFHVTGTAIEVFKVYVGSWSYPDPSLIRIADVPLFSGFMYAAVGSYMARVVRLFDMEIAPFPPQWMHFGLAILVYVNFFSHHYTIDIRYTLFVATVLLYGRTKIWFRVRRRWMWMPLPFAALLSSFFLWIAENIGTATGTLDLSRFDAHPLIAFTATKEIDYGIETDGRVSPRCGAYRADQRADTQASCR